MPGAASRAGTTPTLGAVCASWRFSVDVFAINILSSSSSKGGAIPTAGVSLLQTVNLVFRAERIHDAHLDVWCRLRGSRDILGIYEGLKVRIGQTACLFLSRAVVFVESLVNEIWTFVCDIADNEKA